MVGERAWIFAAGLALGIGATCFVKSGMGRKAAVAVAEKGLALKDRVATVAERAKETASDIMAEARYAREQKGDA